MQFGDMVYKSVFFPSWHKKQQLRSSETSEEQDAVGQECPEQAQRKNHGTQVIPNSSGYRPVKL